MKDDFNKEAMREKVRVNCANGWTIPEIKKELMRESAQHLGSMAKLEARVIELSDQIEFMNQEYPNV